MSEPNRFARDSSDQKYFEMGLFRICDALHGSWTGAGDALLVDEMEAMLSYLKHRIENWSWVDVSPYDIAVYSLVQTALTERFEK